MRRTLVLVLLSSCSRTPSQNPTPPPATSASSPIDAGASAAPPALLIGEGCHAGVSLEGAPKEVLERVRKACMPDSVVLRAPSQDSGKVSFRVDDPGACLRVAAVGAKSTNVTLVLLDDKGAELAHDSLPGAIALVSASGPVCVSTAGDYRVEIAGAASFGIWRAP